MYKIFLKVFKSQKVSSFLKSCMSFLFCKFLQNLREKERKRERERERARERESERARERESERARERESERARERERERERVMQNVIFWSVVSISNIIFSNPKPMFHHFYFFILSIVILRYNHIYNKLMRMVQSISIERKVLGILLKNYSLRSLFYVPCCR